MGTRQGFSIRTSIWVAVAMTVASTILGAGALYTYQLSRSRDYLEQSRAQTLAEVYAAAVEPLMTQDSAQPIREYVEQLRWHPSLCLIAVLGPDGGLVASRGNQPLLNRFLATTRNEYLPLQTRVWHIAADSTRGVPPLMLAGVPIGVTQPRKAFGAVICATRLSSAAHVSSRQSWKFFGCLMLIAATGFLLGSTFLRQCVVAPLATLTQQGHKARGNGEAALPTHRRDEIGHLAKLMADMNGDATEWRERTLSLRRNLSHRVNSETAKIQRELQQAQRKIWSDPLTQLGNRRLLDDKLDDIYRVQKEAGEDFCIAMIDVDNFKKLNDSLGHQAGDDLLKFIGELLRQTLREGDLAIRFGGDEFALILPGVSIANARSIGERTIRLFAQHSSLLASDPKPSMSLGIASMLTHRSTSAENLMHMADAALYAVKRGGKAQVGVYDPALPAKSHGR